MGGGERRTVVFKPLGARDAATSSCVAEASFQVRLQTHPGQTYTNGKNTGRPQRALSRPQQNETPTNKRPKATRFA